MNINTMEEKEENRFFLQYIIGSDKIQDGLWSNDLKKDLKNNKSKEEMQENIEIIIHERKKERKRYVLILIDTLISTTTIAPLVVAFWMVTWSLMDAHEDMFPFWLCFTFGIMIHTMFGFVKYLLYEHFNEKKKNDLVNRIVHQSLKITYTYIFGVMCIMHWRGGWILLDKYFNMQILWINASITSTFLGALIMLRCLRNLLAPPFVVAIDNYSRIFLFPSLCKQNFHVKRVRDRYSKKMLQFKQTFPVLFVLPLRYIYLKRYSSFDIYKNSSA